MAFWLGFGSGLMAAGPLWFAVYALCKAAAEPPHTWGKLTEDHLPVWSETKRRRG